MNTTVVQWKPDPQTGQTTQVFEWLAMRFFLYTVGPLTLSTFFAWYVVYKSVDREEKQRKRSDDDFFEMRKV